MQKPFSSKTFFSTLIFRKKIQHSKKYFKSCLKMNDMYRLKHFHFLFYFGLKGKWKKKEKSTEKNMFLHSIHNVMFEH